MTKKRSYLVGAMLAGCLACTTAGAADAPLYFGVKGILADWDAPGFDEAYNVGLNVGYELLQESWGTVAVEGEYTTTISDGEIGGGGEWDADTLAAYGVYRSLGDIYAKGKAGFLDQDVKRSGTGGGTVANGDESGFSFGAGVGFRLTRGSAIEAEYTVASDDLTFISVGYVTRF